LNTNFIEFIPKGELFNRNGDEIRISDMSAKVEIPEKLNEILKSDEQYILFAGFGGYTGTFVTEEIAKILNQNKKEFSIICSIPFRFEGQRRMQYANELKQKIQNNSDFHFLELEQLRTKYGEMSIKDAFEKADEELFMIFDKQFNN
jgi:cell division protein FtsZ